MTGLAETNTYSGLANNARYAPFARVTEAAGEPRQQRGVRFSALGVIAAFLVFSGVTVVLAKGQAGIAEQYGISQESLLGFAWALQGLLALIGFALAVRWLRS